MNKTKFSPYGTMGYEKINAPKPKEKQPKASITYAQRDKKGKDKK